MTTATENHDSNADRDLLNKAVQDQQEIIQKQQETLEASQKLAEEMAEMLDSQNKQLKDYAAREAKYRQKVKALLNSIDEVSTPKPATASQTAAKVLACTGGIYAIGKGVQYLYGALSSRKKAV